MEGEAGQWGEESAGWVGQGRASFSLAIQFMAPAMASEVVKGLAGEGKGFFDVFSGGKVTLAAAAPSRRDGRN